MAKASKDDTDRLIVAMAESEAMPDATRNSILRRYRREKTVELKGRTICRNVLMLDAAGVVREQVLDHVPMDPLDEDDIFWMVIQDAEWD